METPLNARMNHGRWIVDCPNPECRGAELARPGEPFVCSDCHIQEAIEQGGVAGASTRARQIAESRGEVYALHFPADKAAIEAALRPRPLESMNWTPGESQDLLRRENAAHGIR